MQPTVHCLVNITDTPFFVVELNNVKSAWDQIFWSLVTLHERLSTFILSVAPFVLRTSTSSSFSRTLSLHRCRSMPCQCTNLTQSKSGSLTVQSHTLPVCSDLGIGSLAVANHKNLTTGGTSKHVVEKCYESCEKRCTILRRD